MATSVNEEGISLIQSCSEDSITSEDSRDNNNTVGHVLHTERKRKWPFRSIGSRRLVLILVWGFLIDCSLSLTNYKLQYTRLLVEDNTVSPWSTHWNKLAMLATFAIFCPLASLLAEVIVGRYQLISHSMKVLWLLSIAGTILSICQYHLPRAGDAIYNVQFYLVVVPSIALQGAFIATAIPLGLDQITDGSNTTVCAYIVWFVWITCSGESIVISLAMVLYRCFHMHTNDVSVIISIIPVFLLSVGLIIDFYFNQILVKEPVSSNPVSLIVRVLKYAAKHKFPVQRSAFTYCENKLPTRLDNGKSKYGGPFTTEQVEDVKTFWRILVVILVFSLFNIALIPLLESNTSLEKKFRGYNSQSVDCVQASSSKIYTSYSFVTYSVPLYELLVYPCLRHSGPSILQSAGIGASLTVSAAVYGMMVETTRQVLDNTTTTECMFEQQKHTGSNINHFLVAIPFNFILGFAIIVLSTSNIQFICAQAPYNTKGFLIGLSYMLQTMFSALGAVFYIAWLDKWFDMLFTYTCGTWFYLSILVIAIALCVLLSWMVRWYKGRQRDETMSEQRLVEDLYYKYDKKDRNSTSSRLVTYQLL